MTWAFGARPTLERPLAWPCLGRKEVHLWRAPLDLDRECLAQLREMLSSEERALALTFRFQWDRDRFVASRGWLRLLLGRYVGVPPNGLRFAIQANGKPALAEPPTSVRFTLALAGPLALMAIAEGREVGIGVEPLPDPGVTSRSLPEASFSQVPPPSESQGARMDSEGRARWGAYYRARGWPMAANGQRRPLVPPDAEGPSGWSFHGVDAGPGYTGALALEGMVELVRHLDCDPRWLHGRPPD
jgi:4'-phosphopantetheinyl transferase